MQEKNLIFFAFGAMFCWSFGDFLIQKISHKLGNIETLFWVDLLGSLALTPLILRENFLLVRQNFLPLLLLGLLEFSFGLCILKAFEKGKLSVITVIMTLELPLTVLLGIAFFQEKLSLIQIILIVVIFAGTIIISKRDLGFLDKLKRFFSRKISVLEKGAIFAFIAATLSAFYNFFIAFNAKNIPPVIVIWFPWTTSVILLSIYIAYNKGFLDCLRHMYENKSLIIGGALLDVSAWVFFAVALSKRELSITTAITESYPALTLFLALKYNKEKISTPKILAAIMVILATILIAII